MHKEIKRNNWSRFCKKFSQDNQYRQATIYCNEGNGFQMNLGSDYPLLGIVIEKKGRYIDGVQLLAGRGDADLVAEPVFSIKQPKQIAVTSDESGTIQSLEISSKDGSTMRVDFQGEAAVDQQRALVQKVAYSLFSQHGNSNGRDFDDWLEAEQRVKRTEQAMNS